MVRRKLIIIVAIILCLLIISLVVYTYKISRIKKFAPTVVIVNQEQPKQETSFRCLFQNIACGIWHFYDDNNCFDACLCANGCANNLFGPPQQTCNTAYNNCLNKL